MCTLEPRVTALCRRPSPGNTDSSGPEGAHCPGSTNHRTDSSPSLNPAWLQELTSAQKEDIVSVVQARYSVHSHTLVAGLWLQQQQAAADLPVHQEVVLEEVQHSVWELQGRANLPFPGTVGDALKKAEAGREQQESERRHASTGDSVASPVPPTELQNTVLVQRQIGPVRKPLAYCPLPNLQTGLKKCDSSSCI